MKLTPYQECRSLDAWTPILVQSNTDPHVRYRVHVCPWENPRENICECPGYLFNGKCWHQEEAASSLCRWSEIRSQEKQTPEERKMKICPRCGGPTSWEIDIEEEDESSEDH